MKQICFWPLATVVALLGAASPVLAQSGTSPASHQEGFECLIDLSVLPPPGSYVGPTSISIVTPSQGSATRLCSGNTPNENIKLQCDATIMDWPGVPASASGFTCWIDTDPCDVPGVSGLVQATLSDLTVDEFGAAKLICKWHP